MKQFIKRQLFGKKRYQSLFSRCFDISLSGLNIGTGGQHPRHNGEIWALHNALSKVSERDNLVIFDGGAQIGIYTQCVLDTLLDLNKNATVYGFEPGENEYQKYTEKFLGWKNVIPSHTALNNKIGTVKLYAPKNSTGLGSLYPSDRNKQNVNEAESITIDQFCRDRNIKKIHLLKLDVEGNELNVLRGAEKMLENGSIDFIQFEFGICSLAAKISFRALYDILKSRYTISRILTDGLEEIKNPGLREECFFTTNYLAEKKQT